MLSYLHLTNFKSFSDISIDLRKSHNTPKKMALIYGENGAGKSNLIFSFIFLSQTFNTLINQEKLEEIAPMLESMEKELNSEDGKNEGEQFRKALMDQLIHSKFVTLLELIKKCKRIESDAPSSIHLGFTLNGREGSYFLEFDKKGLRKEELRYLISAREGSHFLITQDKVNLSRVIFKDSKYKEELIENIKKFWGKHTLLSIIFNDANRYNATYIKEKCSSSLLTVLNWFRALNIYYKGSNGSSLAMAVSMRRLASIEQGHIEKKDDRELKAIEGVLNTFFTSLYSDIKSVYYEFSPTKKGKFKYELHFEKCIDDEVLSIPLSLESSGTQRLAELFPVLFEAARGASVIIDEFDNGIHDILMRKIVEALKDSLTGQLIMTTHNTYLLNEATPDEAYVIRVDARGNKTIECIADYGTRTQKNHNMQKKYLRGDYYGIPFTRSFDFAEMVAEIASHHDPKDLSDGE